MLRLNKTLTLMREIEQQGDFFIIYGQKQYQKILNYNAVTGCDINGNIVTIKLIDGSTIKALYCDFVA